MSLNREQLNEYLETLADRFTGAEIVDRLEDAGVISVWEIISCLEDYIIEGKSYLAE